MLYGVYLKNTFTKILSLVALLFSSLIAMGERSTFPTAYMEVEYGLWTTYKSGLVDFNDTGATTALSLGTYAGGDNSLGFSLRQETSAITFSPSSATASNITSTWQDVGIKYRLGFFYLGILFGSLDIKAVVQGTDTVDAIGSGTGAQAGFITELGRGGFFQFDYSTVTIATIKDVSNPNVAVGARADMDIKTGYKLLKWLQLTAGHRTRSYTITTSQAYTETVDATYFGLKFNKDF